MKKELKVKLHKIVYSKKYQKFGAEYHDRHCVVLRRATGRPKNVLVQLRGGELAVVPSGNIRFTGKYLVLGLDRI